jgi:hypothetical protein
MTQRVHTLTASSLRLGLLPLLLLLPLRGE